MKAIETIYKGYRFRSRLEARWAVFFDALGLDWEYEPEGFELGQGIRYLPDFRLKGMGKRDIFSDKDLWVEVKGKMTDLDLLKIELFSGLSPDMWTYEQSDHPVLVVGDIPWEDNYWHLCPDDKDGMIYGSPSFIDGDSSDPVFFGYRDGHYIIESRRSNYTDDYHCELIRNAYIKARQARFEHGEKP